MAFRRWLETERGLAFGTYDELWRWSVTELEQFWGCVWDHLELGPRGDTVLEERVMPGATWFPGTTLNYAERALAHDGTAIEYEREDGLQRTLSYAELRAQVGAAAAGLRRLGVGRGDRVAAVLPSTPEAVVALLATASLGAIWASCSPEFGTDSVVSRFAQIEPSVLIAVDGYRYGGKHHRTADRAREARDRLPTVRHLVSVDELVAEAAEPRFEAVPFAHPLWILFSSGTTGPPKAIVHGHGGITLSALKDLGIMFDVGPDERFFRYTTPTWVMWNVLASALLTGATIVLYDGHPLHPDAGALWRR
jgi:acetoacetyl-CoA synthetase